MTSYDSALARALGFDTEEMAANRQGRLTIRQRNRVFTRQRTIIIATLLITVFIGVVSAIVILAVLSQADASIVAGILAVIGEIITVALAYLVWWLRQRYRRFLLPGQVNQISGPITCYQLKERRSNDKARTGYYVQIDAMEFEVDELALGEFLDGQTYTIYYARCR
jgi:ABC-type lipoprotein release transport system permease subunit